jgi:hypothetical protein
LAVSSLVPGQPELSFLHVQPVFEVDYTILELNSLLRDFYATSFKNPVEQWLQILSNGT